MATPIINQPQVAILDLEAVDQAAGGGDRRRRQRLDRDPADDDPRAELGSPGARRRAVGPVPGHASSGTWRAWRDGASSGSATWAWSSTARRWRCRSGSGRRASTTSCPDVLLTLEHPPVYTRGRRSAPGRAADGRGVVPAAGDRDRRDRPRRQGHLPRPRPARRLSDRARRRRGRVRADARARAGRGAGRRGRRRRAVAATRTAPTTPASGSRSARSPRSACTCRAA